jgi:hypothetical protein
MFRAVISVLFADRSQWYALSIGLTGAVPCEAERRIVLSAANVVDSERMVEHLSVEGQLEFRASPFAPRRAPFDLFSTTWKSELHIFFFTIICHRFAVIAFQDGAVPI